MVAACSMQCASCATWTALSMHKRLQHACHYMLTQAHATHTHTHNRCAHLDIPLCAATAR